MVALVAARGVFHVAQEGVHFGQGELAAGADGAVAGHGGEDVIFVFFDGLAAADLGEFTQDVFGERDDVGFAEHGGDGADGEGVAAHVGQFQSEACQCVGVVGEGGAFFVGRGEGNGDEQALALQVAVFLPLAFHFFVVDALGGGVHVDEQQAVFGLGEDVDA